MTYRRRRRLRARGRRELARVPRPTVRYEITPEGRAALASTRAERVA
jgi:hypothetical protein